MKENFKIVIPWQGQNNVWWNEICANVVEVFGLPGNKFTYHPRYEDMSFIFENKKDYELCRILLSEYI
jgi:hypothetical protein